MSWQAAWDMPAAPSDYQAPTTRFRGPSYASARDQAVAPQASQQYIQDTHHPSNPAQCQHPALIAAQPLALPAAQLPAEGTGHVHPATQPIPIPRRANVEQEDVHAGSYGPDSWSQQDRALSYNAATASTGDPSISSSIGASGAQSMTPATDGRVSPVADPSSASTTPLSVNSGVFPALTPPTDSLAREADYDKLVDMNDISGGLDRLGIDFATLASLPFQDGYDAGEDIGATSPGNSHEPEPTATSNAPVTDPQPVDPTAQVGDSALYAQQAYEDVYDPPVCLSTATTGASPLHPGFATSLADYNHAATPPCMHPPSDDQEYALEAHESLRLALIARPAQGPLVPSGSTKRKTRDPSEDRVLESWSRKRVAGRDQMDGGHSSLENDAMAQWARMPENSRQKWSEVMAAQQLVSADGATTRRSRSQDKSSSLSPANESRAPALGQDTHAISRAPPTAAMRRRGRGAHTTSSRAQSRSGCVQHRASCASKSTSQGRHSFAQSGPSTSSTPDPNPKAPLVKPTHKNGVRKFPQKKVVQRPAGAKVDAYKKCPWKGCEYAYDFDLHGRSDWAQAVKNHLEDTHALEADLEADEKYFTLEGMCEKEKRKGIVSCKMVVDGLPPCTWKGARARFYNHILREEYGM
ncbi:hypothetical protein EV714DRAFT_237127 [Schizophyllum commune]